jgi:hypothetical protein
MTLDLCTVKPREFESLNSSAVPSPEGLYVARLIDFGTRSLEQMETLGAFALMMIKRSTCQSNRTPMKGGELTLDEAVEAQGRGIANHFA